MSDDQDDFPEPITWPDQGWVLVETQQDLEEAVEDLQGSEALAIDTEADSFFSYRESCCLVQITGDNTVDYVVDPLTVEDMSLLAPMMADPKVTKIFHGADYDVVSMKRDFGYEFVNIFDTMIAAQASGHKKFGLNDLVQRYFGQKLNKKWQRHDWSSRPLLDVHIDYARNDSHFLHKLREILWGMAGERGRHDMLAEEFKLLESRSWTGRELDPDDCMRVKGARKLGDQARSVLRSVWMLREGIAESKNRPSFKVFGNDALLRVADKAPTTKDELRELLGDNHHLVRRYSREIVEAINAGLEDERPPPPKNPPAPPPRNPDVPPFMRDDEALLVSLKKWRNATVDDLGLGPGMVVNNQLLKDVAALKPEVAQQLDAIGEMRQWQKDEFGQALVDRVQSWLTSTPAPKAKAEGSGDEAEPGEGGKRRRRRRRRRGGEGGERAEGSGGESGSEGRESSGGASASAPAPAGDAPAS